MNRLLARLFSALCVVLLSAVNAPLAAHAQSARPPVFWFAGTRLIFDSPVALAGDVAVSIHDAGLARFLGRVGATLSYAPQQRYVIVTTADHRLIAFTIGDTRYTVGGAVASAPFAPFFDGNDVIVPFETLARALYVDPIPSGAEIVLQPQLGDLDVHVDGKRTIVTLRGATSLSYTVRSETPDRIVLALHGLGSSLPPARRVGSGVDEVDVATSGSVKNPTATVTLSAPPGSQHLIASAATSYELRIVFGPRGVALNVPPQAVAYPPLEPPRKSSVPLAAQAAPATPIPTAVATPESPAASETTEPMSEAPPPVAMTPAPAVSAVGPATVDDIGWTPATGDKLTVVLHVSGTPSYSWHRLRDERWYLDLANTTLVTSRDAVLDTGTIDALRVHQIGTPAAPVVRIAFTTRGEPPIAVSPGDGTLSIVVGGDVADDDARSGAGRIGPDGIATTSDDSVAATEPQAQPTAWKFGAPPVAAAPAPIDGNRLIVLDPGHGGADVGTAHNGLVEKQLTLDIAMRLRTLLVRAGWTVRMTRDTDIDPVARKWIDAFADDGIPNASDRAYLQTRCDVANANHARMFISIHINYSDSPSVRGTTFYYTKPQDVALAQALERAVIPSAGTQDDGTVKSNLYVTKHTTMPAVLVETAFISNPGDVQRLANPNFLQRVAAGIAAGVGAYAGAPPALQSRADQ